MRSLAHGLSLALLLLGLSTPTLAQQNRYDGAPRVCAGRHLQVTLAIPSEYLAWSENFGYEKRVPSARQVCGSFAVGSPYQLVSWLENGGVQAAVLSDFAKNVMRADDPERFDADYYVLPVQALTTLPHVQRRLLLTNGLGQPLQNPYAQLDDFFLAVRKPGAKETILLSSHLSPSVPYLIRYATHWTERQELDDDAREAFYAAVLKAIRFGKPVQQGDVRENPATYQLVDEIVRLGGAPLPEAVNELKPDLALNLALLEHIVVRKRVFMASSDLRRTIAEARDQSSANSASQKKAERVKDVALFADTRLSEDALGPTLTKFREDNYRRIQFGTVTQRHFRFTIPELWSLLEGVRARDDDGNSRLALVLTGGGVKAAYQTSMIDYLYDARRLVNPGGKEPRPEHAQQVDFVIGTSGGALLGVFVAAMDEAFNQARISSDKNRLTNILWKEPYQGIQSYDVFPFWDMMRYASFIVALVVVWMVAVVMLAVFRSSYPQITRIDHENESFFGRRARAWKESWPWITLLVLAPIVIMKVAGVSRVEHVPLETGVIYAWMALVAFYSDVRLFPKKPFEWLHSRLNKRTAGWLLLGAALIGIAFWRPAFLAGLFWFKDEGLVFVLACGFGFVALMQALHSFFHAQTDYFEAEPRGRIFRSFGVLLGIVMLSYVAVALAMWANVTSLLEMNSGFWKYFLLATLLLTAGYLWLGRAKTAAEAKTFPQVTVGYLFSEFRSRAMFGSEKRFMRFMSLTVVAWLWWNMLVAPALYGNHNARAYLKGAFRDFACVVRESCPEPRAPVEVTDDDDDVNQGKEFPLAVPFVITATSLEKSQERYFLFVSGEDEDAIDEALSDDAWYNVVRDPRWVVVRKPVDKELQHAAFASGSPFPVFSAHDVPLRVLQNKERLIDGGFAHNKPLEAAYALGAHKVLVINSSPLESAGGGRCTLASLSIGELACNLPKLVPYLWERSQVEDLLSTRSMLVASIYPTAADGVWPSLTDFRRASVQELLKQAANDQQQELRVGVIEGWGAPEFSTTGFLGYDADQIRTAIRQAEQTL
jgi:predicted acylesterase/phospholipase RssA